MDDNIITFGKKPAETPPAPEYPPYYTYKFEYKDESERTAHGFCTFGQGWVAVMQGPGEVQLLAFSDNLVNVSVVPEA